MWIQIPNKFKAIVSTMVTEIKRMDPLGIWKTKHERGPNDPSKTITVMIKYGPCITISNLDPDFSVSEDVIIEENIDSNTDDDHDEHMNAYDEYEQARRL